jgi:hypothetical protein
MNNLVMVEEEEWSEEEEEEWEEFEEEWEEEL